MKILQRLVTALLLAFWVLGAQNSSKDDNPDMRGWAERSRTLSWQRPANPYNIPIGSMLFEGAMVGGAALAGCYVFPEALGGWPSIGFAVYTTAMACAALQSSHTIVYHALTCMFNFGWLTFWLMANALARSGPLMGTQMSNALCGFIWLLSYLAFFVASGH